MSTYGLVFVRNHYEIQRQSFPVKAIPRSADKNGDENDEAYRKRAERIFDDYIAEQRKLKALNQRHIIKAVSI